MACARTNSLEIPYFKLNCFNNCNISALKDLNTCQFRNTEDYIKIQRDIVQMDINATFGLSKVKNLIRSVENH